MWAWRAGAHVHCGQGVRVFRHHVFLHCAAHGCVDTSAQPRQRLVSFSVGCSDTAGPAPTPSAAILANTQVPSQEITSIASFEATGEPVCVRQNAAQQAFLATFFPQLNVMPIPGLTQAGLLPAIASGLCKGGVGPDPELKYALGGPGIFDADGFDPERACPALPMRCAHAQLRRLWRGDAACAQTRSASCRLWASASPSDTTGCVRVCASSVTASARPAQLTVCTLR